MDKGIEVTPGPAPRYLNVVVAGEDGWKPHPPTRPLMAGGTYDLLLDIGALSSDSIVEDPDAVPAEQLPPREQGHWLELGIVSTDFVVSHLLRHLFLPSEGPAWICDCEPGGAHRCSSGERRYTIRFGLKVPVEPGPAHARITLYFENNVVQSLRMSADVIAANEPAAPGRVAAVTDYTLSERLADVDRLEPRLASFVVNEMSRGTHLLVFKGGDDKTVPIAFSEGQLTAAMGEMRELLLDVQIKKIGNHRESRLLPGNRKSPDDLRADLTRLAEAGADFWTALYGVAGDPLIQAEEGESRTIQIARVPSSVFVFPWAAVYDLPLGSPEEGYQYCPLIENWDGEAALVPVGATDCPHAAEHRSVENVICPFGFWGFRYAIEEPASTENRTAPLSVNAAAPLSLAVAKSLELDAAETERHLEELGRRLPGFDQTTAASRTEVQERLAEPKLEIAYFYCHGRAATESAKACLEVGKADRIEPRQIVSWRRTAWNEVPDHWLRTKPLVFLNGCHTADLSPQTPVNFVDCFSQVGASGVVGTEITLEQKMASEASEVFFGYLAATPGLGAGEALRRTRLHFLGKGNLLGLAYTTYCRAELTLVP